MASDLAHLRCASCRTKLEPSERADGKCVYCQSRELESEIFDRERAAEQELATIEQEALWR